MDDIDLKIEYLPVEALTPYDRNARKHGDKDVEVIAKSIQSFGFDDPIGVWGDNNIIVEGHGRLLAAKKLGMSKVPVIRLDHLNDEQRRSYALAHNKSAELSAWDDIMLAGELDSIVGIDMSQFGFILGGESSQNPYTSKTNIPQYEIHGDAVRTDELTDTSKADDLIREIEDSKVPPDVKTFLKLAAMRHVVFDYAKIAEYYASASEETQRLMERSALVIIDFDDAIANGYAVLSGEMREMMEHDRQR